MRTKAVAPGRSFLPAGVRRGLRSVVTYRRSQSAHAANVPPNGVTLVRLRAAWRDNASLKYDKVQLNANLQKVPQRPAVPHAARRAIDAAPSFIRYRYANNPGSVYPGKLLNDRSENLFITGRANIQYLDLFERAYVVVF